MSEGWQDTPSGTDVLHRLHRTAARGFEQDDGQPAIEGRSGAEIDRVAHVNGQLRSAWMGQTLARAALAPENDALPIPATSAGGRADDHVRVTVRMDRSELEAIDTVGGSMRLTRTEWIKRTLRWQLWDKAGVLRLAPATQSELGKLRKEVLRIGRNINQAVHAMNAANQPGSALDLARIAGPFIATCGELKDLLTTVRRTCSSCIGAEVAYWTDHGWTDT